MRIVLRMLLGVWLTCALSVRAGECLWHVTFSAPEGRAQGGASAYLFPGEAWHSLEAAETAILLGSFDVSSAAASFLLTPGTSDRLFSVPRNAVDFLNEAIYVVFSAPTVETSAYYEFGWANPNHGNLLQSSNLVGFYVDDDGVIHPVGAAMNDVGLSRSRPLLGLVPEPDGYLLLLVGMGMQELHSRPPRLC